MSETAVNFMKSPINRGVADCVVCTLLDVSLVVQLHVMFDYQRFLKYHTAFVLNCNEVALIADWSVNYSRVLTKAGTSVFPFNLDWSTSDYFLDLYISFELVPLVSLLTLLSCQIMDLPRT